LTGNVLSYDEFELQRDSGFVSLPTVQINVRVGRL
jgi:hypothetical protein